MLEAGLGANLAAAAADHDGAAVAQVGGVAVGRVNLDVHHAVHASRAPRCAGSWCRCGSDRAHAPGAENQRIIGVRLLGGQLRLDGMELAQPTRELLTMRIGVPG